MALMIALIGGQPMPNLLPVRHYHPDEVLLVYTAGTKPQCDRLKPILSRETKVHTLETDAYDIELIKKHMKDKFQELKVLPESLIFNLTGGTKAMVLAAYQVAQDYASPVFYLQSESKQNHIYSYIWRDGQLQLVSDDVLLSEYVRLKDIFDMYVGANNWKEGKPSDNVGGLFEIAIAQVLRTRGYEMMCGIRIFKDIEIDVTIRDKNQIAIIEAKIGEQARSLKGVQQLSTAVRNLGTYTKQFYVINELPSKSHEAIMLASNIQVISLQEYASGMLELTANDASKLVDAIDRAMKG